MPAVSASQVQVKRVRAGTVRTGEEGSADCVPSTSHGCWSLPFIQQYLSNACGKPGPVLGSGETVVSSRGRHYYCSHFTGEKTEPWVG